MQLLVVSFHRQYIHIKCKYLLKNVKTYALNKNYIFTHATGYRIKELKKNTVSKSLRKTEQKYSLLKAVCFRPNDTHFKVAIFLIKNLQALVDISTLILFG